jgi:hypothetical protein
VDLGIEDGAEERLMNILEEERLESGTLTYNQLTDFDWGGLYPDDTAKANLLGVDVDNIHKYE